MKDKEQTTLGNAWERVKNTFSKKEQVSEDTRTLLEGVLTHKQQVIYEKMMFYLKRGEYKQDERDDIANALELRKQLPDSFDPNLIPEYENVIRDVFFDFLYRGATYNADQIVEYFGSGINFKSDKRYVHAAKECFCTSIKEGNIKLAVDAKKTYCQGIDLPSYENYEESVKAGYKVLLASGTYYKARELIRNFGKGMNFESIDGFEESIKTGFVNAMKNGTFADIKEMFMAYNKKMNFRSMDNYEEVVTERFLTMLVNADDDLADFQGIFLRNINISEHQEYESSVRAGFVKAIKDRKLFYAHAIRENYGEGMDFTNEINHEFFIFLNDKNLYVAIEVAKVFERDINFEVLEYYKGLISKETIRQCKQFSITHLTNIHKHLGCKVDLSSEKEYVSSLKAAILKGLEGGHVEMAMEIIKEFGEEIDLTFLQEHTEKEILAGFLKSIFSCEVNRAVQYRDEFLTEEAIASISILDGNASRGLPYAIELGVGYGIDQNKKDEARRLIYYFDTEKSESEWNIFFLQKGYPALFEYLNSDGNTDTSALKQAWYIENDNHVPDELLSELENWILPACNNLIINKIIERLGLPIDQPFDPSKLSEDQLNSLPNLRKKIQTEINNKLQAIVSESVQMAYRKKNESEGGEMNFLTGTDN